MNISGQLVCISIVLLPRSGRVEVVVGPGVDFLLDCLLLLPFELVSGVHVG